MSESELIASLKKGEKAAIHSWYSVYAPKLRSYFAVKVRQTHDVDELTHDTFLSCLKSLPLFRGESSLYSWMLSIAHHELADYYRKLYAKRVVAAVPLGEHLLEAAAQETSEAQDLVKRAMSKMPEAVAELLSLKYIDKLSVEVIADRLALSPHVVQSRLYRARNYFRKLVRELSDEEV